MKKHVISFTVATILILSTACGALATGSNKSEVLYIEQGRELIQKKEYDNAVRLLEKAVKEFPESNVLRADLGRTLMFTGEYKRAEEEFQKAFKIDRTTMVAQQLIEQTRLTQEALTDRDMERRYNLFEGKVINGLTVFLGVFLGTLVPVPLWRQRYAFRKALRHENWDMVTDHLEDFIGNWKKAELRRAMDIMLGSYSQSDVETIITNYVDDASARDKLLYFLERMHAKRCPLTICKQE
ncbi:tetratricopeptide repeat protein [Desulfovibrio subterraneus]|uniref:Tetratricopeptide repeat protein n=1 Tax=Desulfovibrio subterraneus TaxID=2718620 RepID=A0A7J0BPB5_9BACT|nr:tetratricopeptide repeat protein [Desulfovibrio subterraneus]GFM35121.1 hypothetical protein DSM101010T_34860 [Desulfovibrio subterraneus]